MVKKKEQKKDHMAEKYYYEKRAQLSLLKYFGNLYSKETRMSDAPDLIDDNKKVGIEVTRTFYGDHAEATNLFHSECMLKKVGDVKPKVLKRLEELDCLFIIIDETYYGITPPAFFVSTEPIVNAFESKLNKINKGHYEELEEYDLYVFSPCFDTYDIEEIIELKNKMRMMQIGKKLMFRNIYIDDENNIFRCDLINNVVDTYEVNKNDRRAICNESLTSYHQLIGD